jgi:hypothetical protein
MFVLLMIASGIWALICTPAVVQGRGMEAFGFFLFGWGPILAICAFLIRRSIKRQEFHARLLQEVGIQAGAGLDHCEGGDGIAIDPKGKRLVLYNGKRWKAYPYEDVRGWEDIHETAGQIVGAGLGVSGGLAAGASNLGAAQRAAKATGFFVTVRDTQTPKWRITMANAQQRSRWMEIMQQELNEGGLRP